MRTPDFWYQPPGLGARLLAPAAALYTAGAALRRGLARPQPAGLPVICVGNLVAGGAGKTPTVIALATLLAERGYRPHIVSRGYGGRLAGPLRVNSARHGADEVGDEPLLLARAAPTWIARDRRLGALAAAAAGAGLVVLDDGLDNATLALDFRLVAIDGEVGFGNGRRLPAGPLRQGIELGLARADLVLLIGADRTGVAQRVGRPLLPARIAPAAAAPALAGRPVLAFAGIARPAKFFETLRTIGARVIETRAFPDHHRYRPEEIMRLVERAAALGATPVTTEKDLVRLPVEARPMVVAMPIVLAFADEARLLALLDPVLTRIVDAG